MSSKISGNLVFINPLRGFKQRVFKYVVMRTPSSTYYIARKGLFKTTKCSDLHPTLDLAIEELKRVYIGLEIRPKKEPAKDRPVAFIVTEQDYRNPTKFLW